MMDSVLLECVMSPKDEIVERLRALCAQQGGVEHVADQAHLSVESLKQVLAGTKLPSGRPRGLGPKSQASLERAFPGWLFGSRFVQPLASQSFSPTISVEQLLSELGRRLAEVQTDRRAELGDLMRAWVHAAGNPNYEALIVDCLSPSRPGKRAA